jgi:sugar phosphate isomerase/epimerase
MRSIGSLESSCTSETGGKMELTRRSFLKSSTAASAGTILGCGLARAMTSRPVGIQLFTVQDELSKDTPGTLKALRIIGYQEVETFSVPLLKQRRDTAVELKKMINDAGLQNPSAHLPFGVDETQLVLERAHALGVKYVVASTMLPEPITMDVPKIVARMNSLTADDWKKIANNANDIGAKAQAAGFQFAYHNHRHEFRKYGDLTGYDVLLAETDPSLVKLEADCGWMVTAGQDPISYFKKYPGRYRMIHAKDFAADTPVTTFVDTDTKNAPTEIGRGHIDFKSIIAAAEQSGVDHIFVEQDPPIVGMTPLEAVKISYVNIRPLV